MDTKWGGTKGGVGAASCRAHESTQKGLVLLCTGCSLGAEPFQQLKHSPG